MLCGVGALDIPIVSRETQIHSIMAFDFEIQTRPLETTLVCIIHTDEMHQGRTRHQTDVRYNIDWIRRLRRVCSGNLNIELNNGVFYISVQPWVRFSVGFSRYLRIFPFEAEFRLLMSDIGRQEVHSRSSTLRLPDTNFHARFFQGKIIG